MTTRELREKYLRFFASKGHAIIPSSSLMPEHDPTVLFTTAGMHPLVPYLMGEPHPKGRRLVDVQKCIRTTDIDEVGDNRHLTFFEMLGNWSLGDYFKEEAIVWSWEFLTSKHWLGLDPNRLAVSIFAGDADAPRDDEAEAYWLTVGVPKERIFEYAKDKNWWGPAGLTGPCGPDTEMFYDTGKSHDAAFGPECHPNCDCGRWVEIWNDVFMQFNRTSDGRYEPLKQKNVDTGMGLERTVAVLNGGGNVFETDAFAGIIDAIVGVIPQGNHPYPLLVKEGTGGAVSASENRSVRIIADHIRAATFIMGDDLGVVPSNVDQGYVVRRLIRRAVRHGHELGIDKNFTKEVASAVIGTYANVYSELKRNCDKVLQEMEQEEEKFRATLARGAKMFNQFFPQGKVITGKDTFMFYSTYGYPPELTLEMARERNIKVSDHEFEEREQAFAQHQSLSHAGAEKKFKGGLADHTERVVRMHTATHLLHQALRIVLGEHVFQKGSNITNERLRFDFSHPEKMTDEEIKKTEALVNQKIAEDLPVSWAEMTVEEAKARGAIGLFTERYGEKVKVYTIGSFSKEICGGPHVEHTAQVGRFKIIKEESVSAGIRRIKAIVE